MGRLLHGFGKNDASHDGKPQIGFGAAVSAVAWFENIHFLMASLASDGIASGAIGHDGLVVDTHAFGAQSSLDMGIG